MSSVYSESINKNKTKISNTNFMNSSQPLLNIPIFYGNNSSCATYFLYLLSILCYNSSRYHGIH